ncbi:isochorismate synthase MenF [Angustibacter sp. Root456]|uniref:isochorismate synthase n=1 Tax=Angustibacter sp. Root456 TaxID=1736539 RepID=UPI0007019AD9|nr:isochorismate synthase [Angustibacter sp. Root456]
MIDVTVAASGAAAPLVVRTVALDDPGPLLDLLPDEPCVSWVRRGEGLVGWGEAARFASRGDDRFEQAQRWWAETVSGAVVRDEVDLPGTGPVAFGSFTFDAGSPGSVLAVPAVVVGHRGGRWWVTTTATQGALPAAASLARHEARAPGAVTYADGTMSGADWEGVVAQAVQRITRGDVDKVVLARDLEARTAHPVDPRWLLRGLAESYPGCWTFAVDGLVGATPELLVRLERGLVHSRVLAGTISRTGDDDHDLALAASLARSSKDLEEHEYAVRSLADALAPHCTSMNVPEAPFVLHLPNVMHLATDVAGVLSDGATSLTLVAALHPTAAVGGTPTAAAVELIRELEGMDRGRYAGPVGWTDGRGDGEWGIALRCAELDGADPHRVRLFAGCGIVAGSDPARELAESDAKLVPMRDALDRA